MAKTGTRNIASKPELRPTLWHCHRCASHIAIYSAHVIESAICPICCDVMLDPRGSFEAILGISFPKSSPVAAVADFKT